LACAECNDSLPFPAASSIPLCYIPFPSTLFHQLVFHPPSPHLAIYFLVYLSALLLPNSYITFLGEFCFLPFSVHAKTNIIYLTLFKIFCVQNLYTCVQFILCIFVQFLSYTVINDHGINVATTSSTCIEV